MAAACTAVRIAALCTLKAFDGTYTKARQRYLDGERGVVFPPRTYQRRLLHGVAFAGPPGSIALGFPFEAIDLASTRAALLQAAMGFFGL